MDRSFTNLVEMQQYSCRIHSNRKMYGTKSDDKTYSWTSYGDFALAVDRFRGGLAHLGVTQGDKVAVISNNCVEWAVGCYAAYGLCAHYVPMYESQTIEDWTYIIRDSGAKLLLVKNKAIFDRITHLIEEIPSLERVIPLFEDKSEEYCYGSLGKIGSDQPVPALFPDAEEPMGLIYTSGTTGDPKGVILTHKNMITEVQSLYQAFAADPPVSSDRSLSFLPWGHLMGQLEEVHILLYGGFSTGLVRDINEIIEDLSLVRPTIFFAVPRLYTKLYDGVMKNIEQKNKAIQALFASGLKGAARMNQGSKIGVWDAFLTRLAKRLVFGRIKQLFGGRLRMAFSGGAALNENVVEFLSGLDIPLNEAYGLTETTMAVTLNTPIKRKQGSVGTPVPNSIIKIDTNISDTKEGEGEIVAYGPLLMKGYHNLPDETAGAFGPDGGFRTGDLGRIDEDGFLFVTGRIKELYKLENGKYISPAPLEEELKLSPYINQALITGANQQYNVVLVTPEEEAIKTFAREQGINVNQPDWKDSPLIETLFEQEIEKQSLSFKGFEKPRKFKILWDDWSVENALLTPTLKLKRIPITQKYQEIIDTLYDK